MKRKERGRENADRRPVDQTRAPTDL